MPLYFLWGEEPYYIDLISNYIEKNLLSEEEKGFNQMVLYGRDVTVDDIVGNAKRYPMMAERQVIIVKEAQDLSRTIEDLAPYAEEPQPSTVLVLCYKYKKLDGRKALSKALKKNGVIFESKKLYDNQVAGWIQTMVPEKGLGITPKASQMLAEFLGADLGKIVKEIEKLEIVLLPGQQITPELVEENIGISKDFNNFELQKAIGSRNRKRAYAIAQYFGQNSKNHPLPVTIAVLLSFFTKVWQYHALPNTVDAAKKLGINSFFIRDYEVAARNFQMKQVSAAIAAIRETDVKGKGVGAANISQADLLKELLFKIFHS
jgi:DNA polymerase-3 subunit delta